MIEIKIPADIQTYKSKLVFGFTTRQVISIGAALGICVPFGVYGRKFLSDDIVGWLVILFAAPVIAWGFITYKDMHFEDYIRAMFNYYVNPQKRVYEDSECNIFVRTNEEINEIEITQQRVDSGELDTNSRDIDI